MQYRYRIVPAREAIEQFQLGAHVSDEVRQIWREEYDERAQALVFEGDTEWGEEVDLVFWATVRHPGKLAHLVLDGPRFIIVNGNLKATRVGTAFLDGFFVLGNLTCKVVEFGTTPAYVQGNVEAEIAILANAEDDEIASPEEEGRTWIRVGGELVSPVIHTWNFRLAHLRIALGSGKEIAEERISPASQQVPCHYWPAEPSRAVECALK